MAVNHIVYFKFKQGVTDVEIKNHFDMFEELTKIVPGVQSYSAGKTFPVNYEKTADYDCMHVLTYESEKELEEYFFHPKHKEFGEKNNHLWADVLVLNAEIDE